MVRFGSIKYKEDLYKLTNAHVAQEGLLLRTLEGFLQSLLRLCAFKDWKGPPSLYSVSVPFGIRGILVKELDW